VNPPSSRLLFHPVLRNTQNEVSLHWPEIATNVNITGDMTSQNHPNETCTTREYILHAELISTVDQV